MLFVARERIFMENREKLREYTLGSDGFHYVCEHDLANESDSTRCVRYQIETTYRHGELTECTEELLAYIEKENEVYELHKSFSLNKRKELLWIALDLDEGLCKKLITEKRISDSSLATLNEMSEEEVDALMSYLRFTDSLCSAICIYDELLPKTSEMKKPKYDPEWARHAAEDLTERLRLLDVFESDATEADREEYESLLTLAEDIAYSLVLPEEEKYEPGDRRKVLFTNGMSSDMMLIITDAPKEKIEEFCRHLNQEMEDGENTYFDFLKKDYYVNVLFDSELTSEREDVDIIGYNECYDLFNYPAEESIKTTSSSTENHIKFNSAQEMLSYLQSARDLYNPETGEYVWLYNEAGSVAVDKLSDEDIHRILKEREVFCILEDKEEGESWSGYIPGGADIWDDVSYDDEGKVPKGCTNLDYCEGYYAENWVDCKEYERLLLQR